ncbi:MAG: NUDIX domain-containing protein [Chloroflexi bacterium]|nr:NUDIX domain-containing protein [Chloroflexota bacterium]
MPTPSPYVKWLRSHVGHQKVFLVRACGIILDDQGHILLRRSSAFGWWGLPGNLLEPEEQLSECLIRGLRHKVGLTVEPTRLVGLYTSPDYDLTYPNGDQVQQFIACFACRVSSSAPYADETNARNLGYFSPTALPDVPLWYRAMIDDHTANAATASFQRGSPGSPTSQEHIIKLRQYVGQERLVMVGGAGLIRDEADRILLIRRSDDGTWALPAGSMELGERLDQSVAREVGEETGLVVRTERLVGVYAGGATFEHIYPNGDQTAIVTTLFDCQVVGGTLGADNKESLEVRFFPPDHLPPVTELHSIRIRDGLIGQEAAFFQ